MFRGFVNGYKTTEHMKTAFFLSRKEQHPEEELIKSKQDEVNASWQRLKGLALQRQGKLFGAAEVQRFNRYDLGWVC